jgi:hypothetical protein
MKAAICQRYTVVCRGSLIEAIVFVTNNFTGTHCGHWVSAFHYINAMLKRSRNKAGSEYASIGSYASSEGWFRILDSENQAGVAQGLEELNRAYCIPQCVSYKI